jgi:hypothetical protein
MSGMPLISITDCMHAADKTAARHCAGLEPPFCQEQAASFDNEVDQHLAWNDAETEMCREPRRKGSLDASVFV